MPIKFEDLRVLALKENKEVKSFKVKSSTIKITSEKGKFAVYINGEKLDDSFKSAKEAEKNAKDFIKLMGEEIS